MCGIAGSVNHKLPYNEVQAVMGHRGPDESMGYTDSNVDLYHLRLSILDIQGGRQPMYLGNRYAIIFNGQIYNHKELRTQFNLNGKTHSDTETLLLLYSKLGADMLEHLDGMFALAIYDSQESSLFLARDRAGKKPLYIFNNGQKIVFASELNCLNKILPLEVNYNSFFHYTRMGAFYKNSTPYMDVQELQAGTYMLINCNNLSIKEKKWWNIHRFYLERNDDTFNESLEKVEDYLHKAVKQRIESSDLEVGCFLSGGIDSGLVTAMASEYKDAVRTFTVSFNGAYNEAPLAKMVANRYNTNHTELEINFHNLQDDVEGILMNYGEPFFDSSAIPSYYVSREAKKYLTVILNGDGADELFGGYRRYVPFSKYDFFKKSAILKSTASLIKRILPLPHNKKSSYNYLYRLASLASKTNLDIYLSAGVDIMEDYEQHILQPSSGYMEMVRNDFEFLAASPLSGLQKIMNMDFDANLFSDLLVKMDIATMASSLEGRSPFLCKSLLQYVPGMQDEYKIKGTTTKYLLRSLAGKYLPSEIVSQPKRGFEIPLKDWVNNELKHIIHDYVGAPQAYHKNFISNTFTQQLLNNQLPVAAEKRAKILWMLFSIEVWYNKVYNRQK